MKDCSERGSSQTEGMRRVVVSGCPGCHRPLAVPAKYAGRRVACPKCNTGIDIPVGARELLAIECRSCQHRFAVPADFTGQRIRCPECSSFQDVVHPAASEVLGEMPVADGASGSQSGSASSSSNSAIRRWRRLLHCPNCQNIFPVLVDKPANDFPCPKCRHPILDGHCLRQCEVTGRWFHHSSLFGGVKYGPYPSREEAATALLGSVQKKR